MAGQRGDTFNNEGNRGWQFAGPNYGNVFFLGSNHVIGHDDVKGIRAAAEGGNANAQFKLGLMYRKGRNVHQSDDDAVIWYTKAAGQRHPLALNNLGLMYRDGKGVEQSDEEAKASDGCMNMDEAYLNRTKKLSNGTEDQQNKEGRLDNIVWVACMRMDEEVYLNQTKML
uniref:Uncharacterized protein n=1 Tax=Plectus sambesii TaxID=2011161 RepID=A0A914VIG0_9BILA